MKGLKRHNHVFRGILTGLLCIFVLGVFPLSRSGAAPASNIAFSVGNTICVTNTIHIPPRQITSGYDPEISPDGKKIAFTFYTEEGDRFIRTVSLAAGETETFPFILGKNSYGPRWSPDGKKILFNHWDDIHGNWVIGMIDLEEQMFRVLAPEHPGLFSPFWSAGGDAVFAQDLDTLYRIDMGTGRVSAKMPLAPILGKTFASSALRFAVSPKGDMWLFDGEIEGGPGWENEEYPLITAIFLYTPENGEVRQLTDSRICASHPTWLPGGEAFLFSGRTPQKAPALFRQNIGEAKYTIFAAQGENPSCSR